MMQALACKLNKMPQNIENAKEISLEFLSMSLTDEHE